MSDAQPHAGKRRLIGLWLYAVAALVVAMIILGGATRLTGSGLSIVEWRPLTGMVPPLSQTAWQTEFDKYRAIPQYEMINKGMTLDEFKVIYWWEWAHRALGRLTGAAFLLPFLWFLWRGWVAPGLRARLWAIFALGAAQGAVGWWMVASGLADRVDVSQYRLATHLTLACVIYAAILLTAFRLANRAPVAVPPRITVSAVAIFTLIMVQIYLGALVAGLDAGLIYNSWPQIDGRLLPPIAQLFSDSPWWRNLFENRLTVQFNHRMLAYLLLLVALVHALDAARCLRGGPIVASAILLAATLTIQAALGVLTLLHQAPVALALLHQATAIVVLTVGVAHVERVVARRATLSMRPAAMPSLF